MSDSAAALTFQSILLGLLAEVPEDAQPVTARPVKGEPRILVGGELTGASDGRTFPNVDPSTGEAIGDAADGTVVDMRRAIAAAREAFDHTEWAADPGLRSRCLRQLQAAMAEERETLRRDLVAEIGCAVRMTYGDQLDRPIEKLGFYADIAETYAYTCLLYTSPSPRDRS